MRSSDSTGSACGSCLGNILIFLWSVTTYADRTDHFSLMKYGNTTLQRCCSRQSQRSYATVTHLIFKHFARPSENRRGPCFANANLYACNLRVVESLEQQQMTAVVYNNNHNGGSTLFSFGLRRGRDFLCSIQREHFFHGQLRPRYTG